MKIVTVNSKWDYPTKEGKYWVLDRNATDFYIADFCNGVFLENITSDKMGGGSHNNFFEIYGVIKYKFIPKPRL